MTHFDNEQHPVAVIDFDYAEVERRLQIHEAADDQRRADQAEILRRLIASLLAGAASVKRAGLQLHLIAFALKLHEAKTQAELAATLNVSQGTISKGISRTKKNPMLAGLLRANARGHE